MTSESDTTEVPTSWLAATISLLNSMAGEGIFMTDAEDPAALMGEIATHLGVDDEDDPWEAAVAKLAGARI